MSKLTFHCAAALVMSVAWPAYSQDGRIVAQQPFTLDESLRKEIVAKGEFTSAYKTPKDIFDVVERVDMREITYLSDGLRVKGFVLTPKKEGRRYPVLIWNRGGCRESVGVMTRYFAARWLAPFVDWGYVVVASQYRGTAGGEGKDEFGGADVNDVVNLFPLLDSLPRTDPSRIGMAGFSRGALQTYLTLTRTDRIKAAVVVAGWVDVDFKADAARRKELSLPAHDLEDFCLRQVLADYDRNRQAIIDARSPIKWPEKLYKNTPILMLHGTSDWDVLPYGPLDMAAALLKLKHPFRLVMLEGGDHGLVQYDEEVNRVMKAWLDHYVRDGKTWPSLEPQKR
jgi:dipeptidyl aminopeptidase/acylaminoacyl peptidase